MYQLLFYLLYKRFSTSNFNKTPFISAYFLTLTVQGIEILCIYLKFSEYLSINIGNPYNYPIIIFIFVSILDYFLLIKKRFYIIHKFTKKFSQKIYLQNLSIVLVLVHNILFPLVLKI